MANTSLSDLAGAIRRLAEVYDDIPDDLAGAETPAEVAAVAVHYRVQQLLDAVGAGDWYRTQPLRAALWSLLECVCSGVVPARDLERYAVLLEAYAADPAPAAA